MEHRNKERKQQKGSIVSEREGTQGESERNGRNADSDRENQEQREGEKRKDKEIEETKKNIERLRLKKRKREKETARKRTRTTYEAEPSINLTHRCHPTQVSPPQAESPPALILYEMRRFGRLQNSEPEYISSCFGQHSRPHVSPMLFLQSSPDVGSPSESAVRSWRVLGLGDIVKDVSL